MNKIGVLGAKKRGKILTGHELGKNLLKWEVGGNILSGEDDIIVEDVCSIEKRGKVFCRDDPQIMDLYLNILCLTTNIRSPFAEGMLEHYPDVIRRDEML